MSKRERILAIIIGALVLLIVADQLVVRPLMASFASMASEADRLERELDSARMLIDNRQTIHERWQGLVLTGLDAEASALRLELQRRLAEWAAEVDFSLSTLASARTTDHEMFSEMRFVAVGTGSLQQVVRFLAQVEAGAYPLRIVNCDVSSQNASDDELTLRLTLSTIRMNETTATDGETRSMASGVLE